MRSFERKLRGLVHKYDDKYVTLYILADEIAFDTNKFLKTYYTGQNKTITKVTYKVKLNSKSLFHLDKVGQIPTTPNELLEKVVELNVNVKHYNFTYAGEKIIGWNMTLLEMHPI